MNLFKKWNVFYRKIYGHRSVVEIENAGYNVMYELLNHFIPPIIKENQSVKVLRKKALQLIPSQFIYEDGTVYEKVLVSPGFRFWNDGQFRKLICIEKSKE